MTSILSTLGQTEETGGGRFLVTRRDFVRTCMVAAAAVGPAGSLVERVIAAVSKGLKPSVIWLHFQECTGCTMTLLRPSHPGLDELILDLVSLDYHESLFAAAGRPKFAYGRTIHEHCTRRAHFDAGRFAETFGDEGHRQGFCLYKLGCKDPATHASCSVLHFGEVPDAWPIGLGHPCFGCTEQKLAFRAPLHATVEIDRPTPPDTYAPIDAQRGQVGAIATGIAGVVGVALLGAGYTMSKKFGAARETVPTPAGGDGAATPELFAKPNGGNGDGGSTKAEPREEKKSRTDAER